ncbi:hypothetical protein C8Q76DRAFT_633292, partial [Earliella scabrosa]
LTKRIFHSPTLRQDLEEHCVKNSIQPRTVVRSVPTRWNSVAMTLERAIYLQPALDALVRHPRHQGSRSARLGRFKLTKEEWDVLKQLAPILSVFLEATKRMLQSNRPLIHECIQVMDILEGVLKKKSGDFTLKKPVRAAAELGCGVVNKYYAKSDDSIMYRAGTRTLLMR